MEHNYGEQLAVRETKKGALIVIRVCAVILLILLNLLGIFLVIDSEVGTEDRTVGYALIVIAVLFFAGLLFIASRIRSEVIIFEEGVIIKNNKKEHRFHFNEIAGLQDNSATHYIPIPVAGGIAGLAVALVAGAAVTAAGAAVDENRRKNRIRSIIVVPSSTGLKPVGVVNTGGDELSLLYTEWLIKQKSITKENLNSLVLSFGKDFELDKGTFIHKKRRGSIKSTFADFINFKIDTGLLWFNGTDEKGKVKLNGIEINKILNIDLLFYILNMNMEAQCQ